MFSQTEIFADTSSDCNLRFDILNTSSKNIGCVSGRRPVLCMTYKKLETYCFFFAIHRSTHMKLLLFRSVFLEKVTIGQHFIKG